MAPVHSTALASPFKWPQHVTADAHSLLQHLGTPTTPALGIGWRGCWHSCANASGTCADSVVCHCLSPLGGYWRCHDSVLVAIVRCARDHDIVRVLVAVHHTKLGQVNVCLKACTILRVSHSLTTKRHALSAFTRGHSMSSANTTATPWPSLLVATNRV